MAPTTDDLADRLDDLEAKPATPPAEIDAPTVDSGWGSRKLIVGAVIGVLVILVSSGLMLVAMTRIGLQDLPPDAAALLVKFEPTYWLWGVVAGLLFIAAHTGLIQLDKLIDLAREAIPVLKAKYGAKG